MSVYNAEKYLQDAIESILNQTFTDFEFLIINDCSTDNSKNIIFSYKDSRIQYIENEQNIGLTKSLNKGIDIAKGKYIARMDADDISLPERLEKQILFLETNKDHALVGGEAIFIDEYDNQIKTWHCGGDYQLLYSNLFFGNVTPHSSVLIRTKIIKDYKYNENFKFAQDYELWQRIASKYKIANLYDPVILYRNFNQNISSINKEKQYLFAQKVNQIQLNLLGINYSETELMFHYNLIRNNIPDKCDREIRIKILNWILILFKSNNKTNIYHQENFNEKLIYFWTKYFSFETDFNLGIKAIKFIDSPFHKHINIRIKISFFIKCVLYSIFKLDFIKK